MEFSFETLCIHKNLPVKIDLRFSEFEFNFQKSKEIPEPGMGGGSNQVGVWRLCFEAPSGTKPYVEA